MTNSEQGAILILSNKGRMPKAKGKIKMKTRTWKIYGREGHRQRESFNQSCKYDFTKGNDTRIIEVDNSDKTGTNEYSVVRITRNTNEECLSELEGQMSDGIFENSRIGKIEEVF